MALVFMRDCFSSYGEPPMSRRRHGWPQNFNDYYEPSLKLVCHVLLLHSGIFPVKDDINDGLLLPKLFDLVALTHALDLAAQADVRHAMINPRSYVHNNGEGPWINKKIGGERGIIDVA
ncbi:UDP-glucuronate 4-epimerase 3 [Platanthera guangdongensis]|uniref:UDP-glucuronate 4-epimerase 3 n=1 Tax=Platanthera guangdongensis TaxID=2320717 RepID=A0ABR2MXK8_9ASPA